MPYLHWETNSRRAKMAQAVLETTRKTQNPKERKPFMGSVIKPPTKDCRSTPVEKERKEKVRQKMVQAIEQATLRKKYNGKLPKTKMLGPYLMSTDLYMLCGLPEKLYD